MVPLRQFLYFEDLSSTEKKYLGEELVEEIRGIGQRDKSNVRCLQQLCLMRFLDSRKLYTFGYFTLYEDGLKHRTKNAALFLEDDKELEILSQFRHFGTTDLDIYLERIEKIHQLDTMDNKNPDFLFHSLLCQKHASWSKLQVLKRQTTHANREEYNFLAKHLIVNATWHNEQERDAVFILNLLSEGGFFTTRELESFLKRCSRRKFSDIIINQLKDIKHEFVMDKPSNDNNFPVAYDYLHVPEIPNKCFLQELIESTDVFYHDNHSLANFVLEDVINVLCDDIVIAENKDLTTLLASNLLVSGIHLQDKRRYLKMVQGINEHDLELASNNVLLYNKANDVKKCREILYSGKKHNMRGLVIAFSILCST